MSHTSAEPRAKSCSPANPGPCLCTRSAACNPIQPRTARKPSEEWPWEAGPGATQVEV